MRPMHPFRRLPLFCFLHFLQWRGFVFSSPSFHVSSILLIFYLLDSFNNGLLTACDLCTLFGSQSALGMAIPTVVIIAEILKANGVAMEKKVAISIVGSKDENKGRLVQKAKLEIVLEKNDKSPTSVDATAKPALKTETKAAAAADDLKKSESETNDADVEKKEG